MGTQTDTVTLLKLCAWLSVGWGVGNENLTWLPRMAMAHKFGHAQFSKTNGISPKKVGGTKIDTYRIGCELGIFILGPW